jgi:peptidoglycan/LPS O-acetylase OafA/YrhL
LSQNTIKNDLNHLAVLDLVRFLAALSVMFYHLCYWKNGQIPIEANDTNNFWWFGWVGVQIFFVLSGYVIAFSASKTTSISFAKSRFLRLIPTIWICASITFTLKLAWGVDLKTSDLITQLVSTLFINPLGIHLDIVYWTLTIECVFYLLIFLILRLSNFSKLISIMIFIGILSASYNLFVICIEFGYLHNLSPKFTLLLIKLHDMRTARLLLLEHGVFFSLGVLLWHLTQHSSNKKCTGAICIFFSFICTLVVTNAAHQYILEKHAIGVYLMSPTTVFLAGLFLIFTANKLSGYQPLKKIKTKKEVFRFLGLMTFPLYLLHNDAGLILLAKLNLFMPSQASLLLVIVMCFATSIIVFKLIDPPLTRFFRGAWDHAEKFFIPILSQKKVNWD